MNLKPRPNHRIYLDILRRMTPAQRLQKSFELTELSRQLLKDGLRNRHPEMSNEQLHTLYLQRLHPELDILGILQKIRCGTNP